MQRDHRLGFELGDQLLGTFAIGTSCGECFAHLGEVGCTVGDRVDQARNGDLCLVYAPLGFCS
ncbi:hypothetical protein [Sphingomonas jatrophae]|uniref:hypothetical protein n=1 Tax=Sphingomonas jatrophae TaxID=1166337 RepID=UPI001F603E86|nr:hypothetical protein [Sphingomonas jatrophae]